MLVGDFMDALGGYNEAELERTKVLAGLIRKSTALLWNTQIVPEERLEAERLWPLPWDKTEINEAAPVPDDVKIEIDRSHENILNKM